MSMQVKPSQLLAAINLPPFDIAKMKFCNGSKASSVKAWVDNLQATKVMQTSSMLYNALPEVSRLKTDFQNRLDILENLRPSAQYCILGLEKSFLKQPLIMPESAQKAVTVAQSIQKNMIDGYIAIIIQITEKGKANKNIFAMLTKAIHRAITGIGLLFFRNFQIYTHPPTSLWGTLNILYNVAKFYELTDKHVEDPILKFGRSSSIHAAYVRILLLATARTNQISQNEIAIAFREFESWSQAVKLHNGLTDDLENFYAINTIGNSGPVYKSKVADQGTEYYLEIDLKPLLNQLSKQSPDSDEIMGNRSAVNIPKDFPGTLLTHLLNTWSNISQRKHDRRAIGIAAEVCVGLSDCHYFICNGQDFDYFVRSTGGDEPQKISRFSQGITPASHLDNHQNSAIMVHRIVLQDASPGGYCMLWEGEVSAKLSTGEVLGIKEIGKRTWNIGVVKWVRQLKNASQIGVQLISNNARPLGIAQVQESGGYTEYMRCLYIPPSKFGQGKPTLLSASAPFKEFDKIRIIDGEKEWNAKLDRSMFSTKNVKQFQFHNSDAKNDRVLTQTKKTSPTDDFDSNWD